MATTLGWFLGGFILSGLTIVISGFLVGIFQWLVLQGRIPIPGAGLLSQLSDGQQDISLCSSGYPRSLRSFNGVSNRIDNRDSAVDDSASRSALGGLVDHIQ